MSTLILAKALVWVCLIAVAIILLFPVLESLKHQIRKFIHNRKNH